MSEVHSEHHPILDTHLGERRLWTRTMKLTLMRTELEEDDGTSQLSLTPSGIKLQADDVGFRKVFFSPFLFKQHIAESQVLLLLKKD